MRTIHGTTRDLRIFFSAHANGVRTAVVEFHYEHDGNLVAVRAPSPGIGECLEIPRRVHGTRLKASREIRIATVFRHAPSEFVKMIAAHELAHPKQAGHDKAFYQPCTHMTPDHHQLEFDRRLHLTHLDAKRNAQSARRGKR